MMTIARALLRQQFLRFLLVGGLNTLAGYAVYAAMLGLGLNYAMANLVALAFGILLGFQTQGRLVFGDPTQSRFWRFVLCWAVIYGANVGLISQLMRWGLDAYSAGALGLPFTTVCSYLLQKYVVFHGGGSRAGTVEPVERKASL